MTNIYLDPVISHCPFSEGNGGRWLDGGDRVHLGGQREQLPDLRSTVGLGVGQLCLDLLDAAGVHLLALLSSSCQSEVKLAGQGAQQSADHVQTVCEQFTTGGRVEGMEADGKCGEYENIQIL